MLPASNPLHAPLIDGAAAPMSGGAQQSRLTDFSRVEGGHIQPFAHSPLNFYSMVVVVIGSSAVLVFCQTVAGRRF
jgi:hypothetical protein